MEKKVKIQSFDERRIELDDKMKDLLPVAIKEEMKANILKEMTKQKKKKLQEQFEEEADKIDFFKSNYSLEYYPKTCKRTPLYKPLLQKEHEGDPIAEAYRNELKADYELTNVKDKCAYENGDCYFAKLLRKKPSITKIVECPVDQAAIATAHTVNGKTMYQTDYCKDDGEYGVSLSLKAIELKEVKLPEQWLPLALTEYRSSYKDHRGLAPWKLTPDPIKPSTPEIAPTATERKLMDTGTGHSEYQEVYSALGGQVIDDHYHGKIKRLPGELEIT